MSPITIDSDVFGVDEMTDESHENILVAVDPAAEGHDAVMVALSKVAERFLAVDETGTEHQTTAAIEAAAMRDVYTPNYVSDPEPVTGGISLYVDSKGWISPEMATTFKQILSEELGRTGFALRVSVDTPH